VEDACADDHEEKVRLCLARAPLCEADLEVCTGLQETCPALELGTCWWALTAAQAPEHIMTCFEDTHTSESCDARFLRCAWGL
jgi:hypothetical protein